MEEKEKNFFNGFQLICLKGQIEEKCENKGIDFYKHTKAFTNLMHKQQKDGNADMGIVMNKAIKYIDTLKPDIKEEEE